MLLVCFLVLFPFLFNFIRKLNLFLWDRREQRHALLTYLIELRTAATRPGSKVVTLMYNMVKIACILALCSKLNAV